MAQYNQLEAIVRKAGVGNVTGISIPPSSTTMEICVMRLVVISPTGVLLSMIPCLDLTHF